MMEIYPVHYRYADVYQVSVSLVPCTTCVHSLTASTPATHVYRRFGWTFRLSRNVCIAARLEAPQLSLLQVWADCENGQQQTYLHNIFGTQVSTLLYAALFVGSLLAAG